MGVLHRGLAVGDSTPRAPISNPFSVRGPDSIVLVVFRGGKPLNASVRNIQGEQIVVEEFILIRFAVRAKQNLLAIRRPVDGMLVEIALRQLPQLLCRRVDDKNMEPLIVVEAGHALAGVGLVKIASNHHRIAAGLGRSLTWRRGNKCNLLAGDQEISLPIPGKGLLVPCASARNVTSDPSSRTTNSPP